MGTRFLASTEMRVHGHWKQRIVDSDAVDAVQVPNTDIFMPPYTRPAPPAQPRTLRTCPTDTLTHWPDSIDAEAVGTELSAALAVARGDELLPFAGQSVSLIHDVRPAEGIIRKMLTGAEAALAMNDGASSASACGRAGTPAESIPRRRHRVHASAGPS